jgi:hypothetical protein
MYFYLLSLPSLSAGTLSSQVRSPSWLQWDSTVTSSRAFSVVVHSQKISVMQGLARMETLLGSVTFSVAVIFIYVKNKVMIARYAVYGINTRRQDRDIARVDDLLCGGDFPLQSTIVVGL